MTGVLDPKIVGKIGHFFFFVAIFFRRVLGYGVFFIRYHSVFFFLFYTNQFLGEEVLKLPKSRGSIKKKKGVLHLYRSRRLYM